MLSVSDGWHYAALLHECIAIHTVEIQRQGFLACVLSHVRLFVTPWTITTRLLCPWDFPGKNTRVGCGFLLQGIFLTQRSNPCLLKLLHCRKILYPLNHQGRPSLSMGSLEVFSVLRVTSYTGHERQKNLWPWTFTVVGVSVNAS